jgi:hypothetical protein
MNDRNLGTSFTHIKNRFVSDSEYIKSEPRSTLMKAVPLV